MKNAYYSNLMQAQMDEIAKLIERNKELIAESDEIIGKHFDNDDIEYTGEERRNTK